MSYQELRVYLNGAVIRVEHVGDGVWDISGEGIARVAFGPGRTRRDVRHHADRLVGVAGRGYWQRQVDPRVGDTVPCAVDGCTGMVTFQMGPVPAGVPGATGRLKVLHGRCDLRRWHVELLRETEGEG